MQQTSQVNQNSMFGFNMSPECAQEWARSHDFYKNKQIDPSTLKNLADFLMNGLRGSDSDTKRRNIEKVIRSLASEMNVRLSNIRFYSDPDSNIAGGYLKENRSMVLNLANLNSEADFLVTIIHELRHAQQHGFMYQPDNELASRIKFGFDHYTRPTGQIIKNAQYYSNLVEVDAELISYFFTQNILSQLENTPEFTSQPGFTQKLSNAQREYAMSERSFYSQLDTALNIVDLSENARKAILQLAMSYSEQLFSPENRDHSKTTPEMSEAIVKQLDELISSTNGKQIIDYSSGDLYLLKSRIFNGVNSYDLLSHLDDPFMQYLEKLEDRFEIVGQYHYEKFVTTTRSRIAKPLETYVKKYNLPHTNGDYPSMLDSYLANYRDITVQNLLSGKEDSSGNFFRYFIFNCPDLKPMEEYLTDPSYYLDKIPLDILQERAEESVRNKKYSAATWILPEFTEVCEEQISKNMFGKYFTALNVPNKEWEEYSMGQAYDILKKTAPKFIMQHIFDERISDFQEQIFDFCLRFGDVSIERLNKELLAHPIMRLKLMTLKKERSENLPPLLKKLQWKGRPIQYILNPSKKKRDEEQQSLS